MDQKNITLELLVRSGNPKGVRQFAESIELEESKRVEKIAEAGVYSAIKCMWEEAEGGIDSEEVCSFLGQQEFADYFSKVNNTEVLERIIDVLQAGTHAMMEAYAQITAIDVLGIESLAGAIKRNINAPNIKEKIRELVKSGYSLVFSPNDIDPEMVDHYFPIIDKWRDLVNPQRIVQQAIKGIAENIENDDVKLSDRDHDYKKDFIYKALDKLIEMTDRETVSTLAYKFLGNSEAYQKIVEDGKVDSSVSAEKIAGFNNDFLNKALQEYEESIYPSSCYVDNLAKSIHDEDKEYMAQKIGKWFKEGKMRHLLEVVHYKDGVLYDQDTARRVVGEGITQSSESGNWAYLDFVFKLPQHLIDENNPAISGVVTAYRISQQTKEEENEL